ncbi:DegV family protein [Miniphocaeibacter halophilus]|uniref:DegV family protein n=1 Tax=Miniphocaeibacter halophilus TaxID=2931922 RepID=A0AC61MQW0_9FIRM|nr:DegV family protein [Miniphocaeibacter halophilus]QQK07877.1 DegV family protein [Miniphocaeibacter halophilus]
MKDYILIADSSCDLNKKLNKEVKVELVPFNIDVSGETFVDDGKTDLKKFMKNVDESKKAPSTAAPSPNLFMEKFKEKKEIFIITISSKLSATYNNAILAKNMFLEEKEAKIHVFDSKSASSGETLIALKIKEYIDNGLKFEEIVDKVEEFIENMKTFFILDKFDTLVKNGRMSKFTGTIAKALSFKPVMCANNGEIGVFAKTRGYNNAANKLIDTIAETYDNFENRTLIIAHCEAGDRAKNLKNNIAKRCNFKNIEIVETGMLSSVYANTGGVIVAF